MTDTLELTPEMELPPRGTFLTLKKASIARDKHWDPEGKLGPLFYATELGGECGEALNVVKKLEREALGIVGSRDTIEHLSEELADVIICTNNLANKYGIDLLPAISKKFNASSKKVGIPVYLADLS